MTKISSVFSPGIDDHKSAQEHLFSICDYMFNWIYNAKVALYFTFVVTNVSQAFVSLLFLILSGLWIFSHRRNRIKCIDNSFMIVILLSCPMNISGVFLSVDFAPSPTSLGISIIQFFLWLIFGTLDLLVLFSTSKHSFSGFQFVIYTLCSFIHILDFTFALSKNESLKGDFSFEIVSFAILIGLVNAFFLWLLTRKLETHQYIYLPHLVNKASFDDHTISTLVTHGSKEDAEFRDTNSTSIETADLTNDSDFLNFMRAENNYFDLTKDFSLNKNNVQSRTDISLGGLNTFCKGLPSASFCTVHDTFEVHAPSNSQNGIYISNQHEICNVQVPESPHIISQFKKYKANEEIVNNLNNSTTLRTESSDHIVRIKNGGSSTPIRTSSKTENKMENEVYDLNSVSKKGLYETSKTDKECSLNDVSINNSTDNNFHNINESLNTANSTCLNFGISNLNNTVFIPIGKSFILNNNYQLSSSSILNGNNINFHPNTTTTTTTLNLFSNLSDDEDDCIMILSPSCSSSAAHASLRDTTLSMQPRQVLGFSFVHDSHERKQLQLQYQHQNPPVSSPTFDSKVEPSCLQPSIQRKSPHTNYLDGESAPAYEQLQSESELADEMSSSHSSSLPTWAKKLDTSVTRTLQPLEAIAKSVADIQTRFPSAAPELSSLLYSIRESFASAANDGLLGPAWRVDPRRENLLQRKEATSSASSSNLYDVSSHNQDLFVMMKRNNNFNNGIGPKSPNNDTSFFPNSPFRVSSDDTKHQNLVHVINQPSSLAERDNNCHHHHHEQHHIELSPKCNNSSSDANKLNLVSISRLKNPSSSGSSTVLHGNVIDPSIDTNNIDSPSIRLPIDDSPQGGVFARRSVRHSTMPVPQVNHSARHNSHHRMHNKHHRHSHHVEGNKHYNNTNNVYSNYNNSSSRASHLTSHRTFQTAPSTLMHIARTSRDGDDSTDHIQTSIRTHNRSVRYHHQSTRRTHICIPGEHNNKSAEEEHQPYPNDFGDSDIEDINEEKDNSPVTLQPRSSAESHIAVSRSAAFTVGESITTKLLLSQQKKGFSIGASSGWRLQTTGDISPASLPADDAGVEGWRANEENVSSSSSSSNSVASRSASFVALAEDHNNEICNVQQVYVSGELSKDAIEYPIISSSVTQKRSLEYFNYKNSPVLSAFSANFPIRDILQDGIKNEKNGGEDYNIRNNTHIRNQRLNLLSAASVQTITSFGGGGDAPFAPNQFSSSVSTNSHLETSTLINNSNNNNSPNALLLPSEEDTSNFRKNVEPQVNPPQMEVSSGFGVGSDSENPSSFIHTINHDITATAALNNYGSLSTAYRHQPQMIPSPPPPSSNCYDEICSRSTPQSAVRRERRRCFTTAGDTHVSSNARRALGEESLSQRTNGVTVSSVVGGVDGVRDGSTFMPHFNSSSVDEDFLFLNGNEVNAATQNMRRKSTNDRAYLDSLVSKQKHDSDSTEFDEKINSNLLNTENWKNTHETNEKAPVMFPALRDQSENSMAEEIGTLSAALAVSSSPLLQRSHTVIHKNPIDLCSLNNSNIINNNYNNNISNNVVQSPMKSSHYSIPPIGTASSSTATINDPNNISIAQSSKTIINPGLAVSRRKLSGRLQNLGQSGLQSTISTGTHRMAQDIVVALESAENTSFVHADNYKTSRSSLQLIDERHIRGLLATLRPAIGRPGDWHLNTFAVRDATQNQPLLFIGGSIFGRFDVESLGIDRKKLMHLLRAIEDGYDRQLPYHNNVHAADVLNSTFYLLNVSHGVAHMPGLDLLGSLVAAAAHDIGHIGRRNPFLVASSHALALQFNDRHVLENHHAATLWKLLRSKNMDILSNLPRADYDSIRALTIELIIETDMARHADSLRAFKMLFAPTDEPYVKCLSITLSQLNTQLENQLATRLSAFEKSISCAWPEVQDSRSRLVQLEEIWCVRDAPASNAANICPFDDAHGAIELLGGVCDCNYYSSQQQFMSTNTHISTSYNSTTSLFNTSTNHNFPTSIHANPSTALQLVNEIENIERKQGVNLVERGGWRGPASWRDGSGRLRLQMLKMFLKVADVGHVAKPTASHIVWSGRVSEEFTLQDKDEVSLGLTVAENVIQMTPLAFAEDQASFLKFGILPMVMAVGGVLKSEAFTYDVYFGTLRNLKHWIKEGFWLKAERQAFGIQEDAMSALSPDDEDGEDAEVKSQVDGGSEVDDDENSEADEDEECDCEDCNLYDCEGDDFDFEDDEDYYEDGDEDDEDDDDNNQECDEDEGTNGGRLDLDSVFYLHDDASANAINNNHNLSCSTSMRESSNFKNNSYNKNINNYDESSTERSVSFANNDDHQNLSLDQHRSTCKHSPLMLALKASNSDVSPLLPFTTSNVPSATNLFEFNNIQFEDDGALSSLSNIFESTIKKATSLDTSKDDIVNLKKKSLQPPFLLSDEPPPPHTSSIMSMGVVTRVEEFDCIVEGSTEEETDSFNASSQRHAFLRNSGATSIPPLNHTSHTLNLHNNNNNHIHTTSSSSVLSPCHVNNVTNNISTVGSFISGCQVDSPRLIGISPINISLIPSLSVDDSSLVLSNHLLDEIFQRDSDGNSSHTSLNTTNMDENGNNINFLSTTKTSVKKRKKIAANIDQSSNSHLKIPKTKNNANQGSTSSRRSSVSSNSILSPSSFLPSLSPRASPVSPLVSPPPKGNTSSASKSTKSAPSSVGRKKSSTVSRPPGSSSKSVSKSNVKSSSTNSNSFANGSSSSAPKHPKHSFKSPRAALVGDIHSATPASKLKLPYNNSTSAVASDSNPTAKSSSIISLSTEKIKSSTSSKNRNAPKSGSTAARSSVPSPPRAVVNSTPSPTEEILRMMPMRPRIAFDKIDLSQTRPISSNSNVSSNSQAIIVLPNNIEASSPFASPVGSFRYSASSNQHHNLQPQLQNTPLDFANYQSADIRATNIGHPANLLSPALSSVNSGTHSKTISAPPPSIANATTVTQPVNRPSLGEPVLPSLLDEPSVGLTQTPIILQNFFGENIVDSSSILSSSAVRGGRTESYAALLQSSSNVSIPNNNNKTDRDSFCSSSCSMLDTARSSNFDFTSPPFETLSLLPTQNVDSTPSNAKDPDTIDSASEFSFLLQPTASSASQSPLFPSRQASNVTQSIASFQPLKVDQRRGSVRVRGAQRENFLTNSIPSLITPTGATILGRRKRSSLLISGEAAVTLEQNLMELRMIQKQQKKNEPNTDSKSGGDDDDI